jgi:hypothetical protein
MIVLNRSIQCGGWQAQSGPLAAFQCVKGFPEEITWCSHFAFPIASKTSPAEILTNVISQTHPGATVEGFDVISSRGLGKMVSTAGRATLSLRYRPGSPPLPRRVIVKMTIDKPGAPGVLFETEIGSL